MAHFRPEVDASATWVTAYAPGAGPTVLAVTLSAAMLQATVTRWLRRPIPYTSQVSAVFLVVGGGYLAYYWQLRPGSLT